MEIILTPPLAFLIYVPIVIAISLFGKLLAGRQPESAMQNEIYASGEEGPTNPAAPGYQPFFLIAFFFAVLHLGILVIGSGTFTMQTVPYLLGLVVALIVLLLG